MPIVPATEIAKRFSQYRLAAQREPVAVSHHGRVTEVLISKQDFDEYMRLKAMSARAIAAGELADDTLQALAEARMDGRHGPLDALMED